MILGILLGLPAGMLFGLIMVGQSKSSTGVKAALALPSLIGGGAAGALVGVIAGVLIDLALIQSSPLVTGFEEIKEYESLPLRRAACTNDLVNVRAQLAKPLNAVTARQLGMIVIDCTLSINAKVPPGDEMFGVLMPVLYAHYVSGPAREHDHRVPFRDPDYCGVLENLIRSLDEPRLRLVQKMGLPLHCRAGASRLRLHDWLHDTRLHGPKFDEVLRLIGGRKAALGHAS